MKHSLFFLLIILTLPCPASTLPLEKGERHFQRGDFGAALAAWQRIPSPETELRLRMTRAYRYLGRYREAEALLEEISKQADDATQRVALHTEASILYQAWGRLAQARAELENAALYEISDARIQARSRNQEANLLSAEGYFEQAEALYAKLLQDAALSPEFHAAVAVNRAANSWLLAAEQPAAAFSRAVEAWRAARAANRAQPSGYKHVLAWVTLARQVLDSAQASGVRDLLETARNDLETALHAAHGLENPLAQAAVAAQLGRLYEVRGNLPRALEFTRQAVFWGEQSAAPQQVYQWQWQLGRLLAPRDRAAALAAYRKAVTYLQPFRLQEMARGYRRHVTFSRRSVTDLYIEWVELLLQHAAGVDEAAARQALLEEARQGIERLNLTQLQDYFQDPCVAENTSCQFGPEALDDHQAVLYPLLVPGRLALVLMTRAGLQGILLPQETLKVELLQLAARLRTPPVTEEAARTSRCPSAQRSAGPQALRAAGESILPLAAKVYARLIRPLEAHLHGIEHLVVVPAGLFRLLPFAALHDGERFLFQRYSLSLVPGLCMAHLADAKPTPAAGQLLAGLSLPVQGFSPLPCVTHELSVLAQLAQKSARPFTRLLDAQFTENNVAQNLDSHAGGIVHIASHGSFNPRVEDSFILTYDDRLTLSELETLVRNRAESPQLLTLSACETARGDERAALGLAGVAVKAGVRSSLASLWRVDDEATALLMQRFYRHWLNHGLSKAAALQAAQKDILESSPVYRNPYYWAGFVLIGEAE